MNYRDQLQLQINEAHEALTRAGWLAAARSVDASAAIAGDDLTRLMAAHDHACWHLNQLDRAALQQTNQHDRDCY